MKFEDYLAIIGICLVSLLLFRVTTFANIYTIILLTFGIAILLFILLEIVWRKDEKM